MKLTRVNQLTGTHVMYTALPAAIRLKWKRLGINAAVQLSRRRRVLATPVFKTFLIPEQVISRVKKKLFH
jgi:hypothetical protein